MYVDFATANGTATVADNDYIATGGYFYFSPGQTSATFSVAVHGDKKKEANETLVVNLTGATDGTITDSQGVVAIVNDDGGQGKATATAPA